MNVRHFSPVVLAGLLLCGVAGSGAAHPFGGGGHFGGGAHFGGAHFSGGARFAPRGGLAGPHAGFTGNTARFAAPARAAGAAHYGAPGTRYGGSRFAPGAAGRLRYRGWGGGYWHGGYWPRAYYGPGFVWFLAALPAFCTAYWFDDIPYYYYDNVYYLWSPSAGGYVATDPPPVADGGDDGGDDAGGAAGSRDEYGSTQPAPDAPVTDSSAQAQSPVPANDNDALGAAATAVYAYPSSNQSPQQQSIDRTECSHWAISQVTANGATASPSDARRAMIACLDGRGYSAD